MRLLAVDTTGPEASVAVLAGGAVRAERALPAGRGLAEALVPAIEAVLAESGLDHAGVDLLAVVTGPGGFTGVRAGIATVRGIAVAAGREVVPVTRLAAVAERWAGQGGAFPCVVALDVRRGELAAQRFSAPGLPEGAMLTAGRGAILDRLAGRGEPVVGDAAAAGTGNACGAGAVAAGQAAVRALGRGERPCAGHDVHPLYARAADARPGAGAALVGAVP